jgi:hypothetical protein
MVVFLRDFTFGNLRIQKCKQVIVQHDSRMYPIFGTDSYVQHASIEANAFYWLAVRVANALN